MTLLPRLHRFAPTIPVTDIARSTAFYELALGMTTVFENGDPPRLAILERDGLELHLLWEPGHTPAEHNLCHLLVDDAALLYAHLDAHDVQIVKGIRDADYEMRTFVFADPDGNRIDVGSYLEEANGAG